MDALPASGGSAGRAPLTVPLRTAKARVFHTRYMKTAAVTAARLDDVTFHTLRHTFASRGVMRGVSLKDLQELLALPAREAILALSHAFTPQRP